MKSFICLQLTKTDFIIHFTFLLTILTFIAQNTTKNAIKITKLFNLSNELKTKYEKKLIGYGTPSR